MTPPTTPLFNVLYLLDYVELGGGETSFLNYLRALRRRVPDVHPIVALPHEGTVAQRIAELGVQTHILPWPLRFRWGAFPVFSPLSVARLVRLINRCRVHLVHANNVFGLCYGGLAASVRGRPLVWTCHTRQDLDRIPKRWAARLLADHVLCVSEAVRQEAEHRLGRDGHLSTDYLGIEPFGGGDRPTLRRQIRREFGLSDDCPLVGVVGRFQPVKGQHYLLEALPAVRKRLPNTVVWLIGDAIFGEQEQQYKIRLERMVEQHGLGQHVRFMGFRTDARRLMRALDALVISSEEESFGMAVIEAMEAGIPLVAPDIGGPREIIDVPRTGLLFTPRRSDDLARQLIQALTGEGRGEAFDEQAGPRRVAKHFMVDLHVCRTLAVYAKLTGHRFGIEVEHEFPGTT